MSAIDLVSIEQEFAWRPWAVAYFLIVGAAVGAALASQALRARFGPPAARSALRVAAILALSAPPILLADLHQPARFLNFYLTAAPQSVMWWGAFVMPAFVGATLLAAFTDATGRWPGLARPARIAMVAAGFGVLGYTAGETGLVAARPLWHNAFFPLVMTLTALTAGLGAVLATTSPAPAAARLLRQALAFGSAAALIVVGLWLLADPHMARLALEQMPLVMLGHVAVLGLALPAILALSGGGSASARLAGVAALWGALAFRWALVMGAQAQSRIESATYGPQALLDPATLQSLTGSLGMIALAAVLVTLLSAHLAPAARRLADVDTV